MLKDTFLQTFSDTIYPAALTEKYELLECLGAGEYSETLLVKDFVSGKKYIAKCYSGGMMPSGQNEADILKKLSHPAIPRFIETISDQTMVCVVREYVEGITLDALRQKQDLTEQEVTALGVSLCDVLAYLHSQTPPVIHRDLKPQNIVLREDGSVALIDFGISRSYHGGSETDTVIVGTKHFAAPEQYGFSQTDCRSDLFSLGVVLNYLLTGSAKVDADVLPDGALKRAIVGCVEFSPRDRFSHAQAVKSVLSKELQPMQKRRKKRLFAAGMICLTVLIIVAAVFLVQQSNRFKEPLIEQAALVSLGKAPGETLTEEEYLAVKTLWIVGDQCLADGMSYYAATPAWADAGEIRSGITTLADLKRFPNLTEVGIYGAHISDLSPLTDLSELVKVDFGQNDIADASPLGDVEKLYAVHLPYNPLTEVSRLAEHPDIFALQLDGCDNYDPSFLTAFPYFEALYLANKTDSYKYLSGKKILELRLERSEIDDLSYLAQVEGLEILTLRETPLSSLTGIEAHTQLRELDISHTAITDLSPLTELSALETLTVSEDMREYVEAINTENFRVIFDG